MKKFLLILMIFSIIYVMPVMVQAEEKLVPTTSEVVVQENEINIDTTKTKQKYAVGNYNIYEKPDVMSTVLGVSLLNTTFEVIHEESGWSIITTQSGVAYIKTESLSDSENEIVNYTEEELYIMAHLLAGEAQSQPDEEQLYVGSVAINRVYDERFPDTLAGVVFQKGQYACTWDGNYYREPTDRNWKNAKYLLQYGSVLPSNVVWQSSGKQGKGVYLKTKWHYFCY